LTAEVEAKLKPTVESIWIEFSTRLGQFIHARVADPLAAEDILQDVFVKLQKRAGEFHDLNNIKGWLILVARNAIVDHYRTRKTTTELPDSLPAEASENDIEMEELKTEFHRIIYSLPEPYRDALVLTEFEGLTQEELAKRLGISLSGAKSRVQRAREQLRKMLLDYCHREFKHAIGCQPCPKGLLPTVQAVKFPAGANVDKNRATLEGIQSGVGKEIPVENDVTEARRALNKPRRLSSARRK
jgi:RNA polymerase sigma-70 factor, ECF subfamily